MTLEELVRYYSEELNSDSHWTVIWKENDIWQGEVLYLPPMESLDWLDASWLDGIYSRDLQAIVINRCDWNGEITADQISAMYQEGLRSRQIPWFLNRYYTKDTIIKEDSQCLEDMSYSEKLYPEESDPFTFDGSMSLEDYERMHELQSSEKKTKKEKRTGRCLGK